MIITLRRALSFAACFTATVDLDFCNDALFQMLMETLGESSRFDRRTYLDPLTLVKSFCGYTQNLRKQFESPMVIVQGKSYCSDGLKNV
jgi:hypothetical protein